MMIPILLLFVTSATAIPGYAGSSSNSVRGGYGYGYSGSFSGSNAGASGGFNPIPPIGPIGPPGGDFGVLFSDYFDQLQRYLNNGGSATSYSFAYANNNARVNAQSSISFVDNLGLQQQQFQHGGGQIYNYHPDDFNRIGGTDGSAIASASIGPQGYSQTAAVYPENPAVPNIFSRFGSVQSGGPGEYGVFTSSVSSSSTDPDGKSRHYQQASTTVNDNGKVTTYTVKNP